MSNLNKSIYAVVFLLVVVTFGMLGYRYNKWLEPSEKQSKNVTNSEKIQKGMNINEVLLIMGPADDTLYNTNLNEGYSYQLYYEGPPLAESNILFNVNDSGIVTPPLPRASQRVVWLNKKGLLKLVDQIFLKNEPKLQVS